MYILSRAYFWQLIFADDYMWSASGVFATIHFLEAVLPHRGLGANFSWKKFRGGFVVDWVGY